MLTGKIFLAGLAASFFAPAFFLLGAQGAETVENLQKKIDERNQAIQALEAEIAGYQEQLEDVGKEAKTLQNAIRGIDLEQKKLSAQIKVTETRISTLTLSIQGLAGDIILKEARIGGHREVIGEAIRSINEIENATLVEALLSQETLSSFWEHVDELERLASSVRKDLTRTQELKAQLEEVKEKNERNRRALVALRAELADQTELLSQNKRAKSSLLTKTKSKETEYKKMLAQKVALRDAFEQELLQFESQLKFAIDPSALPRAGSGVLKWPLDAVKITQYFGNTSFARAGGYNGKGHNGIDLRASIGTSVKSALSGVVVGVGNTDTVCPGASYGKWVLIEHGNGLSTLYAHLSIIKVQEGQRVGTGEIIGYAGDTGYATGPHLHLTVYATQGVRVMQRKSGVCKGTYTMPIADLKAYLNPLLYL